MVVKKTGVRFECGIIKRLVGRTECPEVEPWVCGETLLSSVLPHLSETRFRTHGFWGWGVVYVWRWWSFLFNFVWGFLLGVGRYYKSVPDKLCPRFAGDESLPRRPRVKDRRGRSTSNCQFSFPDLWNTTENKYSRKNLRLKGER